MTQEDIIRMAEEAGKHLWPLETKFLLRFAALVAAAECEACANDWEALHGYDKHGIAASIRARGKSMTKDEALRLALITLEGWDNHGKWVWPESALQQAKRNTTEAITAIKEALAQPEPWCMKMNGCKTKCEDCPDKSPRENT